MKLIVVAAAILVVPFSIRAANRLALDEIPGPGYLPSLEIRRTHEHFDAGTIETLRYAAPKWVFIGDSMLGTRIDPQYLGEISTNGTDNVVFLASPATGPGWWYLTFKNNVAASGIKPRCTFIFFRDTNLTDTMWRLEGHYGHILDQVAHESEPELDRLVAARRRGVWARLYTLVNQLYEPDVARMWLEPMIRQWFVRYKYPRPQSQLEFDFRMEEHFGIDRLRKDVASDMSQIEIPEFDEVLPSSILPELMKVARENQLQVCFVRVQRRPVNNQPPPQSPELRKYVADLKAWIEANGGLFHDDTGDPEQTLDLYEDGDHFGNRRRYTEIFRKRLDPLFRP